MLVSSMFSDTLAIDELFNKSFCKTTANCKFEFECRPLVVILRAIRDEWPLRGKKFTGVGSVKDN